MRFLPKSIRGQLLVLAFILAIPAASIIVHSGIARRGEVIEKARIETEKAVQSIVSDASNLIAGAQQLLSTLAELPDVKNSNAARIEPILSRLLNLNPQYNNIFVADRSGNVYASAIPLKTALSVAERRYFQNALSTGRFSSGEYMIGKIFGKPTLSCAYPYKNFRGEVDGVIAFVFNLDYFHGLFERSKLPSGSSYTILDHQGVILKRGIASLQYVGTQYPKELLQIMQRWPTGGSFVGRGVDGIEYFRSYQKLSLEHEKKPYMYVIAGIPVKKVHAEADRALLLAIILLSLLMTLVFCFVWQIAKHTIINRIFELQTASKRLAMGDFEGKVSHIIKGGELGELAQTFDDMASSLAEKQNLLESLNTNLEQRITQAIEENRQKDQMLVHQGRMAAMGEMIGNIAHQWRQPLNAVGLMIQNIQIQSEFGVLEKGYVDETVGKAMQTISHMSRTIDDFRNFFRPDKEKTKFEVHQVVQNVLSLLDGSFKSRNIQVIYETSGKAFAFGYPNELSQAIINIFNNACDVLAERNISNPAIMVQTGEENGKAVLTITDNAGGISLEIMNHIFEPYFSTKGPAHGTGLGLFMSKVIVEQNMNGQLSARNSDSGAEFRIEI